ncbi:UPF0149 family protein [Sulfurisoma sediminicola]|uniref:YecA family protein n=1 Tax=Sulfurisoma sediminicola TaxID=1381557 RepID=A0A497XDP3_9PROT|nr:UPF0149 family protein [Sulfurisoma sediminicola]RLJ65132.1 uncharacterized protein DFR35_1788 [Sulfurisoma sediminicola]
MTAAGGPLGERELDELDALLRGDGLPDETMDIAMLDGFLTALAVGPNLIEPQRWLPEVWGGGEPGATAAKELPQPAARITALVLRHWNFLLAQFQAEPENFAPVLYMADEDGGEVAGVEEWCIGFVHGMNIDDAAWQAIFDAAEMAEFLDPILLQGTEAGWQEMVQDPALAAAQADIAEVLPDCVLAIHDFWAPQRAARTTVRLDAPKVGRNDPCPCGSGRKFKKCCGAAAPG